MKKTLAFLLAFVLTIGITAPVSAVESLDSRLTKVTLAVKNILDIGEGYDEFNGTLTDNAYMPYWSLSWSNADEQLYVNADENGKVYRLDRYQQSYDYSYRYDPAFVPTFPSVTRRDAKAAAEAFLAKVLTAGESVNLEDSNEMPRETVNYNFNGTLKFNGLDTPYTVRLNIRNADQVVTSFSRSDLDTAVKGEIPSPTATIAPEQARASLSEIYDFEPLYILTGDEKTAQLVYLPRHNTNYVVNAKPASSWIQRSFPPSHMRDQRARTATLPLPICSKA